MKVHQILRNNPKFTGCKFGIEVEVEGRDLPKFNDNEWVSTVDGSLRGEAYEYIFNSPRTLISSKKAIKKLINKMEENKSILNFSCRTSVHVHMNVMDLEIQELANILYIYYLFEDVLLTYCGEDRHENRFCLSIRNADYILQEIYQYFNDKYLEYFEEGKHKYASLNLAAIPNKGSIEFRGMRGTLDTDVLYPWLDVLASLYMIGCSFNNLKEINSFIEENGISALAKKLFGKHLDLFYKEEMENQVYYNMSLCAEFPELDRSLNMKQAPKFNKIEFILDELEVVEPEPEE